MLTLPCIAPVFMLSIIKTATKESLFYKLPTLVGDVLIQVGVLSFLLYGTDMVREKNPDILCCQEFAGFKSGVTRQKCIDIFAEDAGFQYVYISCNYLYF